MPKESKLFSTAALGVQGTITLYECFGWEMHSWNDKVVTMQRESTHPAYATLVEKQAEFDSLFSQYLHLKEPVLAPPPKPINKKLAVLAFVLGIVPGVLYCVYKKKERKKYDTEVVGLYHQEVEKYEATKKELEAETNHISEEARALFFNI